MRDLLVTFLVFGALPFIMKYPYIGILVWSWLGYMNPHRLTWGFAFNMPFSQIVALVLLLAILFDRTKKSIPFDKTTITWFLFLMWLTMSTLLAMYPADAWPMFDRIVKIQLVTILTLMLMTDQRKINLLICIIVFSIGFYSVKGGIFTLATGGNFRVWGPPGSFIEENNSLALATLMVVPLMIYLYQIATHKWLKPLMVILILLSLASALGSQSRGALVAIIALAGYFWISSSYKLVTGPLLVLLAVVGLSFMPMSWHERMDTIKNYQEDESAMGRINAWHYSINVANDRLFGAGLQSWKVESFAQYAPDPLAVHAAHSIFFGVLGDSGWVGMFLFIAVLIMTWGNLNWVIKRAEKDGQATKLAKMIKLSMVAYCSGGAFLSLSYFDLPWHLIAIALLLRHQCKPVAVRSPLRRMNTGRNGTTPAEAIRSEATCTKAAKTPARNRSAEEPKEKSVAV